MSSVMEELFNEGRRKGKKEGRRKGKKEGRRKGRKEERNKNIFIVTDEMKAAGLPEETIKTITENWMAKADVLDVN